MISDKFQEEIDSGEKQKCEEDLLHYTSKAWKQVESNEFINSWHVGAICHHLQAVSQGHIKKLLINIPPATGKSSVTGVAWPTWEWGHDPTIRRISTSYDNKLTKRDVVKCRKIYQSQWWRQNWGSRFNLVADGKEYLENDLGGYHLASSIAGHITGEHPDRITIDDPIDRGKSERQVARQEVMDWYDLTLATRGMSRGVRTVLIMQRLHQKDLSGHIMEHEYNDWTVIVLPMWYERNRMKTTVIGWNDPRTIPGQLLCPELIDVNNARSLKKKLREYGTAGQLQQRPVPRGGGMVKELALRANMVEPESVPSRVSRRARAWDVGASFDGDFTAGVRISESGGHYYLEDIELGQWETEERDAKMVSTAEQDTRSVTIGVPKDPAAAGKSQAKYWVKMLKKYSVRMMDVKNKTKVSRFEQFATDANNGLIHIVKTPKMMEIVDDVIFQFTTFPNAEHDDICDAAGDAHQIVSTDAKILSEWFSYWKLGDGGSFVFTDDAMVDHVCHQREIKRFAVVIPRSLENTPMVSNNRNSVVTVWGHHMKTNKIFLIFCWAGLTNFEETRDTVDRICGTFGASDISVRGDEVSVTFAESLKKLKFEGANTAVSWAKSIDCAESYGKLVSRCLKSDILLPGAEDSESRNEFVHELCNWCGDPGDLDGYLSSGIAAILKVGDGGSWGGVVGGSGRIAASMKGITAASNLE